MREETNKRGYWQIIVPLVVLFVSMIVLMVNFNVSSNEREEKEIIANFRHTSGHTVDTIYHNLDMMTSCAMPVAAIMENYTSDDLEIAEVAVKEICSSSEAYLAILTNMEGQGLDNDGEWIELAGTDYFEKAKGMEQTYHYVEDDGCTGQAAILSSIPLYKNDEIKSYMFVYYSVQDFKEMMNDLLLETNCLYALLDSDGTIIAQASVKDKLGEGYNFWDSLQQNPNNVKAVEKAQKDIKQQKSGMLYAYDKQVKLPNLVMYEPIGVNDWSIVVCVTGAYIEGLIEKEMEFSHKILRQLVFVIVLFVAVIVIMNVVSRKRSDNQTKVLEEKADTDQLTGLTNKAATERLIKEYLAEHSDEQALIFVLDIDNFKKINDTMGHAFGDEVLSAIGHQLRREFRMSDVIGRTGGDEFMICLKNIKDDAILKKEMGRVEHFFHNFRVGEYVKYSPTASIGVSVFPKNGTDFETLYKAADQALYNAKKRGKNQIAVYGDDRAE